MYEQLLVALDGSPAAERVLEHAEALAAAFGSHVTLLQATVSIEMVLAQEGAGDATTGQIAPTLDPEPVIEADSDSAESYLTSVASRLRGRNLVVSIEHPSGPAETVIVERAAALGASLILMTTHGRSGLGRAIFGSTADSVLRHASCPVLLVRIPHADAESTKS
jgi:nucleotide-binding universal stress UspA family protein